MRVSHTINTHSASNNLTCQVMAVRKQGRLTYLVSKNRKIRIWHQWLRHTSNSMVIRILVLVDGINLQQANYDLSEVFVDSNKLEHNTDEKNKLDNQDVNPVAEIVFTFILQILLINPDLYPDLESLAIDLDHNKLCTIWVTSKSTRTGKRHKSMTLESEKLKGVHADLWGPYNLPSRSGNMYAAILMCKNT